MLSSSILLLSSCAKEFLSWNLPEINLVPESCGTISDIDGNSYATIRIGTQCWMQSNLKVSKYRDGYNIPNITDINQWSLTNTGAWCNYNNALGNGTTYGKLYNWYAVNNSRGLCPTGWHVPSDQEWTTLENDLGSSAGGKLKSTTGWNSPNAGATNSSGFNALPGGYRGNNGGFDSVGYNGYWWSSSGAGSGSAWFRTLFYYYANVYRDDFDQRAGFSVRCARD
jgi:uncharacterized protein (TIGR02145 family)